MTAPGTHRPPPPTVLRMEQARAKFGAFADTYADAVWEGDSLADAFVADFAELGHGRAMRLLRRACREGIDAVPEAPESLRALFAQLDDVPPWVDLDRIDRDSRFIRRYSRQSGIALGAASLLSGYANSAASLPLALTGRYVANAGARTIEVGTWLQAVTTTGGLHRDTPGFELTVRVRIIHALVRAALQDDPRWDVSRWGVPISQAYLAYTLVEFGLIPMRGMRAIGAPYLPHEEAAEYARWRYLGHLLGITPGLLPADAADHRQLEEIYLLTRPPVEDFCRDLVAGINHDFLVIEVGKLLPGPLKRHAMTVVHALERLFLGDVIADDLAVPRTRLLPLIRAVGAAVGAANHVLDLVPVTLPVRTRMGRRYGERALANLRATYDVRHDLVDDSPADVPHPARQSDATGAA